MIFVNALCEKCGLKNRKCTHCDQIKYDVSWLKGRGENEKKGIGAVFA